MRINAILLNRVFLDDGYRLNRLFCSGAKLATQQRNAFTPVNTLKIEKMGKLSNGRVIHAEMKSHDLLEIVIKTQDK